MKKCTRVLWIAALALAACGGGKSNSGTTPDDDHVDETKRQPPSAMVDAAVGLSATGTPDAGLTMPAVAVGPLVTFRLKNSHPDDDLVFSLNHGWQPVISGFSGTPPSAKRILLFPSFCTASCEQSAKARCPHCPKPKTNRQQRKLQKHETVTAGEHKDVAWDGQIYLYEKTKGRVSGRAKSCTCWKKQAVPAGTYSIKACGFRLSKKAGKRSFYECPVVQIKLPPDKPTMVTVEFSGKTK